MSIKVNYKGAEILSYGENGTKTLKTGGKYCEGDISITNTQDGGITPSGSIEITENGTYDVTEKAEAVVNVSGGNPAEDMIAFGLGTLQFYKNDTATSVPFSSMDIYMGYGAKAIKFLSSRNSKSVFFGMLRTASPKYVHLGNVSSINQFTAPSSELKTLIINCSSVPSLTNANAFYKSSSSKFYVPDTLVEDFKVATNWSTFATHFAGFSDAPDYSETTSYSNGAVCKYNGKFYGMCNRNAIENGLSIVGNAPTGTEEDNSYWEYVATL